MYVSKCPMSKYWQCQYTYHFSSLRFFLAFQKFSNCIHPDVYSWRFFGVLDRVAQGSVWSEDSHWNQMRASHWPRLLRWTLDNIWMICRRELMWRWRCTIFDDVQYYSVFSLSVLDAKQLPGDQWCCICRVSSRTCCRCHGRRDSATFLLTNRGEQEIFSRIPWVLA